MRKTGGGSFDPQERNVYFIASQVYQIDIGQQCHDHILLAVNEINSDNDLDAIQQWIRNGKKVFLDSGVYNLATSHAHAHGLSMDQALSLPPKNIDGFAELLEKYIAIMTRFSADIWGYIEIDLGGKDNKIKTRTYLESLGLQPIPVYHPLVDGWDYFDYLAERYDRICIGNVVMANAQTRKRILATAWERKRKYPDLWIHLLGYTPNQFVNAFPINSCDSSSWLNGQRWGSSCRLKIDNASFDMMPKGFRYVRTKDGNKDITKKSVIASMKLSALMCNMNMRNWRNHINGWQSLGCELWPSPTGEIQHGT